MLDHAVVSRTLYLCVCVCVCVRVCVRWCRPSPARNTVHGPNDAPDPGKYRTKSDGKETVRRRRPNRTSNRYRYGTHIKLGCVQDCLYRNQIAMCTRHHHISALPVFIIRATIETH